MDQSRAEGGTAAGAEVRAVQPGGPLPLIDVLLMARRAVDDDRERVIEPGHRAPTRSFLARLR